MKPCDKVPLEIKKASVSWSLVFPFREGESKDFFAKWEAQATQSTGLRDKCDSGCWAEVSISGLRHLASNLKHSK